MSYQKAMKVEHEHSFKYDNPMSIISVICDRMTCLCAGEADLVAFHVRRLLDSGLAARDIAVVAPYNLQVLQSVCLR